MVAAAQQSHWLLRVVVALILIACAYGVWSVATEYHRHALDMALIAAAKSGNPESVQTALKAGANPAARVPSTKRPEGLLAWLTTIVHPRKQSDHVGQTVLAYSAQHSSVQIVDALLVMGARVDATDEEGDTALHDATFSSGDDPSTIEALAGYRADVNAADANGYTPLIYACLYAHPLQVRALIAHGARLDYTTPWGLTALGAVNLNLQNDRLQALWPTYKKIADILASAEASR